MAALARLLPLRSSRVCQVQSERPAFMRVSVAGRPAVQIGVDLESNDPYAQWFLHHDWIDEPVMRAFLDLVRPGARVLDLGSHVGTFSLAAAGVGAEVIAADANPKHVRLVEAAAARNGFERFRVAHGVVGSTTEPVPFLEAGMHGRVIWPGESDERAVVRPALTVDGLLAESGWDAIDAVKMDVEGSELEVLRGARALLERGCRPPLVLEGNATALAQAGSSISELRTALADLGYELYQIDHLRPGVLVRTPPDTPQPEAAVDYLAVTALPEQFATGWTVEPPFSLERTLIRLLDQASSDARGYRRYAASVLAGGPPGLRTHPLAVAGRNALELDIADEVVHAIAAEIPADAPTGATPAPGDHGSDVAVLAIDLAVAQPLALDLPPAFDLAPAVQALHGVSFHVRAGQALGVVADTPGDATALIGALTGARSFSGRLHVRGPVALVSSVAALVERELTVAENIAVIAGSFGGDIGEVRGRIDALADVAGIRELFGRPLRDIPAPAVLKLVLTVAIESMTRGLLVIDALPPILDERYRAWARQRLAERCSHGLAVVQVGSGAGELMVTPDRGLWLADGTAVACGHWESVEHAFQQARLGLRRQAPRVAPRPRRVTAPAPAGIGSGIEIGSEVLVAALLTSPSPGEGAPQGAVHGDLADYLQPWVDSVHLFPDLQAVVLHDGLPPTVIEQLASPQLSFLAAPPPNRPLPAPLRRYEALAGLLAGAEQVERLWFTDIDDVGFVLHPFRWLDALGLADTHLCIGEEWGSGEGNEWLARACRELGPAYDALLRPPWTNRPLLSPSAWAASRATAVELTELVLDEVDRLQADGAGADIPALPVVNLVAQRHLAARLVTFKLDASLSGPIDEAGAFVRGIGNPMIHDRQKALAVVGELKRRTGR